MFTKFLAALVLTMCFFACTSDPGQETAGQEVPVTESGIKANSLEDLKAQAIAEEDRFARVNYSLGIVQKEYQLCNFKVKGQGKMTVFLDEHFTMLIRNEIDDDVIDTKVNLKHLDHEQGALSLIADNAPGEFPGLRIKVMEGKPGVEITKNGELIAEERELKIYMAERAKH